MKLTSSPLNLNSFLISKFIGEIVKMWKKVVSLTNLKDMTRQWRESGTGL
jgi:hypothetical protein